MPLARQRPEGLIAHLAWLSIDTGTGLRFISESGSPEGRLRGLRLASACTPVVHPFPLPEMLGFVPAEPALTGPGLHRRLDGACIPTDLPGVRRAGSLCLTWPVAIRGVDHLGQLGRRWSLVLSPSRGRSSGLRAVVPEATQREIGVRAVLLCLPDGDLRCWPRDPPFAKEFAQGIARLPPLAP